MVFESDMFGLISNFLCEYDNEVSNRQGGAMSRIKWPSLGNHSFAIQVVKCPAGHLTHAFLACDERSACWLSHRTYEKIRARSEKTSRKACPTPMTSLPVAFVCITRTQRVPYSTVCDHRKQCEDGSDERFCIFPSCSGSTPLKCDSSSQCVSASAFCNNQGDCLHDVDEARCYVKYRDEYISPAIVDFMPIPFSMKKLVSVCPDTHFQCPHNDFCLPVFVRCNGINDCPGREDEVSCDGASCPGFYRCRSSSVCLHPRQVCDEMYQCPEQDDERFCGVACPAGCECHGLSVTCNKPFREDIHSDVKYVDASGSGISPLRLGGRMMLIFLCLSECGLKALPSMTFPNLLTLDLSNNEVNTISAYHLSGLLNLRHLSLSNNPLKSLFPPDNEQLSFPALTILDVSGVRMKTWNTSSVAYFTKLHLLNLSQCGVDLINGEGLHTMSELRILDITGCPMTQFPQTFLRAMIGLVTVEADNFRICCPGNLPVGFNPANCKAPFDEVSSCESLLRSEIYVVFLFVFSMLTTFGNLTCFLTRSLLSKKNSSSFGVFVTHLSISDFLMGVYLAIIGVADRLYKGSYLWEDRKWRHSTSCTMAGFLSLLSNEVSAFIISLITLDRFLVLRFPFSNVHFKARSAHVACILVWTVASMIVVVPLTPLTSHWSFYGHTGICIPLPVSRGHFAGHKYAFGVTIVLNFILFLLIAAGQAAIYVSIQASRLPSVDSTQKSNEQRIARRLISVAVSDFMCWFPIGLLGLLASRGFPVPSEVNVGLAVLVMPLNSALNPFLYTINMLLERRRKSRDDKLLKHLKSQLSQYERNEQ